MKPTVLSFAACALLLITLMAGNAFGQECPKAGSLSFSSRSSELSREAMAALDALAEEMGGGSCRMVISGSSGGSKVAQAQERSWERVNAVIDYIVKRKPAIDRERFISNYLGNAAKDHVSYRPAQNDDKGSSREDDPHPGILKK